ncbi:hypothetical protein [Hymenobacter sp. B1770]|uniref:hypothetical protein n=1 Tax=Hymenobacter sp. B1770 TaxID=1718788 RepID=UPI003CFB4EA3
MKGISKLGAVGFVLCLLTLIGNDWFGKTMFANALTGKLSDFAGLFAFPFVFSLLLPRYVKTVHWTIALLFLMWKSEAVQPLLDLLNSWGLPIGRTVDYTDCMALLSVPVSYFVIGRAPSLQLNHRQFTAVICISSVAFMATTMARIQTRKYVGINKEYRFAFSQRELVSRLNLLQTQYINRLSGDVDFDSGSNIYYYHPTGDTLAVLLDYRRVQPGDTLRLRNALAEIQVSGDSATSVLKLVSVRYFFKPGDKQNEEAYKTQAVKQFERRIVKKIKNSR